MSEAASLPFLEVPGHVQVKTCPNTLHTFGSTSRCAWTVPSVRSSADASEPTGLFGGLEGARRCGPGRPLLDAADRAPPQTLVRSLRHLAAAEETTGALGLRAPAQASLRPRQQRVKLSAARC